MMSDAALVKAKPIISYRYPNTDKRRAYMREYMKARRKRRAADKAKSDGQEA